MIRGSCNVRAADRLQFRNQNFDSLQSFLAKTTFSRELMRRDRPFVYFIEQELTERVKAIESVIDDR